MAERTPKMIVKKIPINKINPAPYNPRKDLQPGDPEYQKLLKNHGYSLSFRPYSIRPLQVNYLLDHFIPQLSLIIE